MGNFFGLRGSKLNYAISFIAGTDFLLFGYDQGIMGGILTMHDFLETFPSINARAEGLSSAEAATASTYQGIAVSCYNLGCFLGAIMAVWISNPLGRKKMIMIGTSIMVIGAALQASAFTLEHFIFGRILTGVGNGLNTSTVPTWQAETSKSHKRGKLVMIEGALIAGGIMISNWVDLGFSLIGSSVAWRFPLAFQCFFCFLILAFVGGLPESPRWLILKGKEAQAHEVLAALADLPVEDKRVQAEFDIIKDAALESSKGSFSEVFTMNKDRNFHRALLGYMSQVFQQISGCNLITYYAPVICTNLGMSEFMALLLASCIATEYFLISWPAVFIIERVGRRKLLLIGAAGQAATMAILAGVNSVTSPSTQIAAIVFLFVFNSFFAFGWLGIPWLYPSEVVPLRIRAPANALSTSANWIFNFLVVMITPVAFETIGYKTYIIFAVINAFMFVCIQLFWPETAYRSLEEIDRIFHRVEGHGKIKSYFSVVQAARDEPRRYDKNGELLMLGENGSAEDKARTSFEENKASSVGSNSDLEKSGAAQGGLFEDERK